MGMKTKNEPLTITLAVARRFLLLHQGLLPPRALKAATGVKAYLRRVGCIQFDPVNVVGRNPDLVLQARLADYRPKLLAMMLYRHRTVMDTWDKVSSICLTSDWPYFDRHRQLMFEHFWDKGKAEDILARRLLEHIRTNGAYDPNGTHSKELVTWSWGRPARLERAALEILYAVGKVGVADRTGNRRIYDLIERLIPANVLEASDPNITLAGYHDWHVLRRISGLGLAQAVSGQYWLGIQYMKTPERRQSLERLLASGKIREINIHELPGRTLYMRTCDLSELKRAQSPTPIKSQACFLPPLDNLLWDRQLLKGIFGFEYTWEVYKKAHLRTYGHYTLPVLFGERFVARFEPVFERKTGLFGIKGWWWEEGVRPTSAMKTALQACLDAFTDYLGAKRLKYFK
jgi:uncharacterized protein YcaQ